MCLSFLCTVWENNINVLGSIVSQVCLSFWIATLPPGPYYLFLQEFADFAAYFVTYTDNIQMMGDFNIHVDDPTDPLSKAFTALPDFTGFTKVGDPNQPIFTRIH